MHNMHHKLSQGTRGDVPAGGKTKSLVYTAYNSVYGQVHTKYAAIVYVCLCLHSGLFVLAVC